MGMGLQQAQKILNDAVKDVERSRAQLGAANAALAEANAKVNSVMGAGMKPAEVGRALHAIHTAQEQIKQTAQTIGVAEQQIRAAI